MSLISIPTRYFNPASALTGECVIPGDKSISHRSLIFASQALGTTHISGLLESEDVLATLQALRQCGVEIAKVGNKWHVEGRGVGGLQESADVLDCGNSGTSARLLLGLLASYEFNSFFTGDASLRTRPMRRVIVPLTEMGASFQTASNQTFPLSMQGSQTLLPITYELPVASAQVKSAILLAGLNTAGTTTVIEPHPSRDHSEKMFNFFGWDCTVEAHGQQGRKITLKGQQQLERKDRHIIVSGDPSSAAFPLVAACIVPDSHTTLRNVGLNPLRTGIITTLREMGAKIEIINEREEGGEPVGDLMVVYAPLNAVTVPEHRVPSMIDEFPILAIAAAFAKGTSQFKGLKELRVKESDRFALIVEGLRACGVEVKTKDDSMEIIGTAGQKIDGGATIDCQHDHRIAMSFLIAGIRSVEPVKLQGCESIATSFPQFFDLMNSLGVEEATPEKISTHQGPLVIAIDGPAASGKGTLGRRLAAALGLKYLDTGRLYRAVGMKLLYNGFEPEDETAAIEAAKQIELQDLQNPRLRQEHVGRAASIVSAMPQVRAELLEFQRRAAKSEKGAVLDGRDIGTVVCPDADYKFFITANLETRAERRHRELSGQGVTVIYSSVMEDLKERDARDSQRDTAPLKSAPDAKTIDTSDLDADDVLKQVLAMVRGE